MTTDTPCGLAAYRPHFAEKARQLFKLGMTDVELASAFRVSRDTLLEWEASIPAFANALWEGRTMCDGKVADGLYQRAVGASHGAVRIFLIAGTEKTIQVPYTRHYPPETPACKFWLAKRRPQNWGEKVEIQVVSDNDTDPYTDAQLEAVVAKEDRAGLAIPQGCSR